MVSIAEQKDSLKFEKGMEECDPPGLIIEETVIIMSRRGSFLLFHVVA
tara:strand:+ start:1690 stop:1833 length:144 start_codon:yes stop_codon:yes gene_type:complete